MLFLSWNMFLLPVNGILRFDYYTELDILIHEMRLFMGLKHLEVFLLSEEKRKTSGTNPRSHSRLGEKCVPQSKRQRTELGKEHREKKLASLFHFISFSVTVTHIISLHSIPPLVCP